ncbi:MAG: hypothetical protein HDR88_11385 [Bacteroides sp.]|nr:hypothetical protein [Bacteroides sp.]
MKSIRKTIRNSRLATSNQIKTWLKPRMGAIGTRYRLAARIRLANSWASKHPKKTFGYVVGTLLTVLFCDIAVTGIRAESQMENMNHIANVEPIFNGFRAIQANKESQRQTILEMTGQGQTLRHELDSLIAIPRKSHNDSVEIIRRYTRLENIVKSLKQNDNE